MKKTVLIICLAIAGIINVNAQTRVIVRRPVDRVAVVPARAVIVRPARPTVVVRLAVTVARPKASAMQNKTPGERAKFQTEMMKNKLGLDSMQVNQVEAINLKYALKNEPVLRSDKNKLSKFKQLKA
eukprot:gene11646-15555_t